MKSFSCRDAGYECDWKTTGQTDDEIVQKAGEHGRAEHGIKEVTQDLVNKVKSKIRDIKAA